MNRSCGITGCNENCSDDDDGGGGGDDDDNDGSLLEGRFIGFYATWE